MFEAFKQGCRQGYDCSKVVIILSTILAEFSIQYQRNTGMGSIQGEHLRVAMELTNKDRKTAVIKYRVVILVAVLFAVESRVWS